MSRLESAIRRLEAQRACLGQAAAVLATLPGPVFELGLGNGRTYDHLRSLLPEREIFVFDRQLSAHPASLPPRAYLVLGEFRDTLAQALVRFSGTVALVHADIGAKDTAATDASARLVARYAPRLLRRGGILFCDQEVGGPALQPLPPPPGIDPRRYFGYRRV